MNDAPDWPPADINPSDTDRILKIENALLEMAGGPAEFQVEMVSLIRLAIDEVIDPGRSGRFRFSELEQTEKAYIGVRTEILFRNKFSLERGALDVVIAGEDVDIKNTTTKSWMIPTHSIEKPCLLIRSNVGSDPGDCSVGLVIARQSYMRPSANQDKKTSFSSAHLDKIKWMFRDQKFPPNILEGLNEEEWRSILSLSSGQKRVAALFEKIQRLPVPRQIVEGVARQQDAMKRVRINGGARDLTEPKGLFILSYRQQGSFIRRLGLPGADQSSFISITPQNNAERSIISEYLASEKRS